MIAWHPTGQRLIKREINVSFKRLSGQARERRCLCQAVHTDLSKAFDARANLRRIDRSIYGLVRDDNFGCNVRWNGLLRRSHFKSSLIHHHEVYDFHSGVLIGCETQNAVDLHAVEPRVADRVESHRVAGRNADLVVCRRNLASRPDL